jgi:hypothetical protein
MKFSYRPDAAVYILHKITMTNGVTHHLGIRNEMQILSLLHVKKLRGRHVVVNVCRKLQQAGTDVFCQRYTAHAKFRENRSPLSDV